MGGVLAVFRRSYNINSMKRRYCQRQALAAAKNANDGGGWGRWQTTATVGVPRNWASSSTFHHKLFASPYRPSSATEEVTSKKWFEVCLLQIVWTLLEFSRDDMNECQGMHFWCTYRAPGWMKRRMPTEHFYVIFMSRSGGIFFSVEVAMHPRQPWIMFIHVCVKRLRGELCVNALGCGLWELNIKMNFWWKVWGRLQQESSEVHIASSKDFFFKRIFGKIFYCDFLRIIDTWIEGEHVWVECSRMILGYRIN